MLVTDSFQQHYNLIKKRHNKIEISSKQVNESVNVTKYR